MQKLSRAIFYSLILVTTLLILIFSPMMTQISILEDSVDDRMYSSTIQATISPTFGWTSGGEEITITGSGFSELAFSNITDDGINHQWVDNTADYTDQAGEWSSMAVDSNGHVHVVHINGGNYQIRHSVYDGTSWNSATIMNCGHTYCWDVDMVIDDNDEIHAAYTTYNSNYESLVYLHYDGTSWSDTEVSPSANFGPIGIAVDSNNNPHISHAISGEHCGDGLRLASYTGSAWTYRSVDIGSNRGCDSDIVINENDNIYISYQVREQSKLKVATNKSGSWDLYTADSGVSLSSLYPGYMTSMVMDGQGQLHIAHFDDKNDDLRYSTGITNGQWTTSIVEQTGHTGREPSIAVDIADNPHIVYHSWSGFNLKYAIINPATSGWSISTISNADVGNGDSLFIDQNGVMHVSFYDGDNEVMNYATKSTGLSQTNEIRVQFGQYGSVTGTVVDDTTITVMTPLSGLTPDTIDITLWDKDDNSHILSSTFEFISQDDLDNDGILNANDDCPNDAGTSTEDLTGCPDNDGDGYSNSGDAFPNDYSEYADTDGDGVGDNGDAFPSNELEQYDLDGDGVGDNTDAFPNDANESIDTDGDGVGDNADVYPFNANEWEDLDGNQIPDNSEASKIQITSSSQDLKIHPYHIYSNNLTLTIDVISSEGYTIVSIQSDPEITPNTGGLPYGFYGGDSQMITLDSSKIMNHLSQEFFTGEYISDFTPLINFTVHVTGAPHGCEGSPEFWDTQQQTDCPNKVANYRTDYYANFSMMLWNGDDDNDGVANSWDLFPLDANESQDSDGDGIGDFSDLCSGTVESEAVDANGCSAMQLDADGDELIDYNLTCSPSILEVNNSDSIATLNCLLFNPTDYVEVIVIILTSDGLMFSAPGSITLGPNSSVEFEVTFRGDSGQTGIRTATISTQLSTIDSAPCPVCPTHQSTVIIDFKKEEITSADSDGDGVLDENDLIIEKEEDDSFVYELLSGDPATVASTVGFGAIFIALIGFLQTNFVAALLPETLRWLQFARKKSKLNTEERRELLHLQSVVQAYSSEPELLDDELRVLAADINARYTNKELKNNTRDLLMTLIRDLRKMELRELSEIAFNDSYFGLLGTIDAKQRSQKLQEDLAMRSVDSRFEKVVEKDQELFTNLKTHIPTENMTGVVNQNDGHEYLEWPAASGRWYIRNRNTNEWYEWKG